MEWFTNSLNAQPRATLFPHHFFHITFSTSLFPHHFFHITFSTLPSSHITFEKEYESYV